jgi:hypothetical protein
MGQNAPQIASTRHLKAILRQNNFPYTWEGDFKNPRAIPEKNQF